MNKPTQSFVSEDISDDLKGRAYGRPAPFSDKKLCEVGPGTPGGELLRRYWQPFALSSEIGADLPAAVRLLGEDLVAFRDGDGKVGLMYPRCMHRGASLTLGKIEAEGLRCPYHGWMFDTQGHLIDTQCELGSDEGLKKRIRQPWYPVMEHHGLVFAFMGPPGKEPLFPRVPRVFEELADDEEIIPSGGMRPDLGLSHLLQGDQDYNWMSYYENHMDPLHVATLHTTINGIQFIDRVSHMPVHTKFRQTPGGYGASWLVHWRSEKEGLVTQEVRESCIPNMVLRGPVTRPGGPQMDWVVPVDDTNYRTFALRVAKKGASGAETINNKSKAMGMFQPDWGPGKSLYRDWTLEDQQRWQTDYLVQKSQGAIHLHSEEHLTSADAAVVMMRRLFKQQADIVMAGGDPIGAKPGQAFVIDTYAGTAHLDAKTGDLIGGSVRATLAEF